MRNFLPSLGALQVLEAAARHGSFTRAAEELNVTQTAVSHQIKGLENQLGVRLFVRERNTLRLTDTAKSYLPAVRAAIATLSEATEALVRREQDSVLTVSVFATLALKWLIPRLAGFRAKHPDISLRMSASTAFGDFDSTTYDVGIRWGHGDWSGLRADELFPEIIFPVCNPSLLAHNPLREPADLARHSIIGSGSSFLLRDDWQRWLRKAGCADLKLEASITFEYALPALEAAAAGLGIALGRPPIIDADIAAGRLIRPFETQVVTGAGYYLVSATNVANRPKVMKFRNWLLEEICKPQAK
jgi:LysR family glycine cleavage system transcriptional activator